METLPSRPRISCGNPECCIELKRQEHRPNPEKPFVGKIQGSWFAQVIKDALGKVPELLAALARRKLVGTEK